MNGRNIQPARATAPIRVAVLGQGRSGHDIHLRRLSSEPQRFRVVAAAALNPAQTSEAVALGARAYGDYRDLLADTTLEADLIVNALPSRYHPDATIAALERGYHVISEKPAARSIADVDRIIETALRTNRHWLPFQNSRFNRVFEKTREIIAGGRLGKVVHLRLVWGGFGRRWDWQTLQDAWGGNLLNTGPHPLDMAIMLMSDLAASDCPQRGRPGAAAGVDADAQIVYPQVFARMVSENPFGDADNLSLVTLYGDGLPVVEVVLSSFMSYPMGDIIQASGTTGCLTGGARELRWRWFDAAGAPPHTVAADWVPDRAYCNEQLDWHEETWSVPADYDAFDHMSARFYDNAFAVLTSGAAQIVTWEQVRAQVAVLEACLAQNPLPQRHTIAR